MELIDVVVQTQRSFTLPWEEILLMPIGDVQLGSEACDFDKFRRHMDWGRKHNAYYIGMGDYLDVASPSGRQKIRSAEFYDSVEDALEETVRGQLDKFYDACKGTEGRWLGLVHGHHFYEFRDGTHSDILLCQKLKAPYLGTCGIVQLSFRTHITNRGKVKVNHAVQGQIWVHHGQGSGATMAAPINKLERMLGRFPEVDVFLLGHYSRKVGYPIDALVARFRPNPKLLAKRRILACTGGFMKGYLVGAGKKRSGRPEGGYVEKGMMPPTNLGGLVIRLRPVHGNSEDRLDMNIEL